MCAKDQAAARDGQRSGAFAMHQPRPNRIQRRFHQQNRGGRKRGHVPDGARHEQVGHADLKNAQIDNDRRIRARRYVSPERRRQAHQKSNRLPAVTVAVAAFERPRLSHPAQSGDGKRPGNAGRARRFRCPTRDWARWRRRVLRPGKSTPCRAPSRTGKPGRPKRRMRSPSSSGPMNRR